MMTHDEKIAHLMEDLEAHGLNPQKANPPFYRTLRTMGIGTKPPHFQPAWVNFLSCAVPLVVVVLPLGALFVLCSGLHWIVLITFVVGAVSAFVRTWRMAETYEMEARKLELPAWEDYPAVPPPGEEALPEPTPHAIEPDTRYRAKK
jgi:hypothetical protein